MAGVAIVKAEGDRVEQAVRHAVALAGGLESVIPPGASVLVKPNVVSPSPSGSGHITDARVTEAVLKLALECRPRRVVLGEGSSVGYDFPGRKDTLQCLEASGAAEAARNRYGAATLIEQDTCTGCIGELFSTFIYLEKAGFAERLRDLTLVMGTPDALPPSQGRR